MATITDEAIRLLTDAGVDVTGEDERSLPLSRVEICERLMAYCRDDPAQWSRLRWDTPVLGLADRYPEETEWFLFGVEENAFGLAHIEGEGGTLTSFGDLLLHIEGRLRELWWRGSTAACPSQALFYELRRMVRMQGVSASPSRLRPRTRLRDCLPADRVDRIHPFLRRRFGIAELPVEERVLGVTVLEIGATWLALWFPCFLLWLVVCGDPWVPRAWVLPGFIVPPILIALLLGLLSRPTWIRVRTLADLTRWLLRRNEQVIDRVKLAGERWA